MTSLELHRYAALTVSALSLITKKAKLSLMYVSCKMLTSAFPADTF